MQWLVLILIGVLLGLGVESRPDLVKKASIVLLILVFWYWGQQHP